ncbi:hypothetical protein Glove_779g1 [Diversispora epigaea]|uniref:BAH domain-containing protein n=1 Tax=Diversispora epigaea TaxID=1348612 RepID=A0A397G3T9_9GLOM|nr:hypothetical protein Glove_779g1 [Diversispora epigaea]
MSAIRKTKKKFQSPRSKFTYVRNSKNNPSNLNTSHNHFDNMFNEDNLQEYFDKYNESDNNNQQQQENMMIENNTYFTGDSVIFWSNSSKNNIMKGQIRAIIHNDKKEILIKIEKYNELNELPHNIQRKRQKKINNNKSLWLVEEDFCFIFKNNLISKLNVFFDKNNNNNINQYDYFINEIIYKKSGVFITRPIESRQPLPCEYIQEPYNPKNLPVEYIYNLEICPFIKENF